MSTEPLATDGNVKRMCAADTVRVELAVFSDQAHGRVLLRRVEVEAVLREHQELLRSLMAAVATLEDARDGKTVMVNGQIADVKRLVEKARG